MLGAPTETPAPDITIPLPKEIQTMVLEARKHRMGRMPLLPPLVRKGYRVPKEDWAMLGAIRRPDRIFDTYSNVKKSAKGVS